MDTDSESDPFEYDDAGSDENEDDFVEMGMEPEASTSEFKREGDDFQYDVMTADQLVQHMVDSIKEVNSVIQVTDPTFLYEMLF